MVKKLLYLNGLAALGAVLYHASGWGFIAMFWWTDRYRPVSVPNFDQMNSLSYFSLRFVEQFIIFAIPAFIFVSGYFLAFATGRSRNTVGWDVIFNRVKKFLIPYILWSLIMIALDGILGASLSPGRIAVALVTGAATPAFYFIPVLIQLSLISPFLIPIARDHWKMLLLGAGLIQFSISAIRYTQILGLDIPALDPILFLTHTWLFPTFIFWFVLGITFGLHNQQLKLLFHHWRWVALAGWVSFLALGMIEWETLLRLSGKDWIPPQETLLDYLYALCFLITFLAFDQFPLWLHRKVDYIGSRSFGIYLAHSLILILASKGIYHLAPFLLQYQILFQPILISLGLAIPLAIMQAMTNSPARRYYSWFFG